MNDKKKLDGITEVIIGSAIEVHRNLGPGLLESTYETCLVFELEKLKLNIERQKPLPLIYKGVKLDVGYRLDLLVENKVVVEVKAVDTLTDIHRAQLLSYLKLLGCKLGLLINFHVKLLKDGICRMIN